MTAERRGTPAVGVMTSAFVDSAEIMARACGMPGYRFAVIDHPVASATDDELRQRAVELMRQACELLLEAPAATGAKTTD